MPDNPKLANIKIKTSAYDRKKPNASKNRKRSRSQKSLNQTKEENSDNVLKKKKRRDSSNANKSVNIISQNHETLGVL